MLSSYLKIGFFDKKKKKKVIIEIKKKMLWQV